MITVLLATAAYVCALVLLVAAIVLYWRRPRRFFALLACSGLCLLADGLLLRSAAVEIVGASGAGLAVLAWRLFGGGTGIRRRVGSILRGSAKARRGRPGAGGV